MAYTNSSLVSYTLLSNSFTEGRNCIDTITIHCTAGRNSARGIAEWFYPKKGDNSASSNYAIGTDGEIALIVQEKNRSWCSSSSYNDSRAITIEVSSDSYSPYAVSDASFASLLNLCTDICRRNGIAKLKWSTSKSDRVNHRNGCNMTVHRDYANKSCPGDYLYNRMGEIANEVNRRLGLTGEDIQQYVPKKKIYIDPGHGGDSIGATFNGRIEQDDTWRLSQAVGDILKRQQGVEVKYSRTENSNPSLTSRCNEANSWGANYFISIHRNAASHNAADGCEVWVYSQVATDGGTYNKAKNINDLVCANAGFKNRGIHKGAPSYSDFAVNSYTNMNSCLLEVGFIDSDKDNGIFDSKFNEIASAIAKGLCDAVGVTYSPNAQGSSGTPTTPPETPTPTPVVEDVKPVEVEAGVLGKNVSADEKVVKVFTGYAGYSQYGTDYPIELYVSYKTTLQSIASSGATVRVDCKMFVKVADKASIGQWDDSGSYLGKNTNTFTQEAPEKTKGIFKIGEQHFDYIHTDMSSSVDVDICWKWGVNSPWAKMVNPSGSFKITLPKRDILASLSLLDSFYDDGRLGFIYRNPLYKGEVETLQVGLFQEASAINALAEYRNLDVDQSMHTGKIEFTEAEREGLREYSPNALEKTVYVVLREKFVNESDYIYIHYPIKLQIRDANPEISKIVIQGEQEETPTELDYIEIVPLLDDEGQPRAGLPSNCIINGCSNINYKFKITPKKEARITEYTITCGKNKIREAVVNNEESSGEIEVSGSITRCEPEFAGNTAFIYFSAKDSRGIETEEVVEVNFCPYTYLTSTLETKIEANGDVNFKVFGYYFDGYFDAFAETPAIHNRLTIEYRWKEKKNLNYTEWAVLADTVDNPEAMIVGIPTTEDGQFYFETTLHDFNPDKLYEFQARPVDKIMVANDWDKASTASLTPVFDWSYHDFAFNVPVAISGSRVLTDNNVDYVIEQKAVIDNGGSNKSNIMFYKLWKSGIIEIVLQGSIFFAAGEQRKRYINEDAIGREKLTFNFPLDFVLDSIPRTNNWGLETQGAVSTCYEEDEDAPGTYNTEALSATLKYLRSSIGKWNYIIRDVKREPLPNVSSEDENIIYPSCKMIFTTTIKGYWERPKLQDLSWSDIANISAQGRAKDFFSIGDSKEIKLNGTITNAFEFNNEKVKAFIIGFDHNAEFEGNGIHFALFRDIDDRDVCLTYKYETETYSGQKRFNMNHSATQGSPETAWQKCDLRFDVLGSTNDTNVLLGEEEDEANNTAALNPPSGTLMSCLPQDLRSIMKPMAKYTYNYYADFSLAGEDYIIKTVDYLPLLSEYEVRGATYESDSFEQHKQEQYEYFKDNEKRNKYKFVQQGEDISSDTASWWLRSPAFLIHESGSPYAYEAFCYYGGSSAREKSRVSLGVAPIFKV